MENQEFTTLCLIGETRYSAGIFLSGAIARRKSYGIHLRLTVFQDFQNAYEQFVSMYSGKVDMRTFQVNRLYKVREDNIFSVFSTPYMIEICRSCDFVSEMRRHFGTEHFRVWERGNLAYEEAMKIAKERFVRYWRDESLYI